MTAGFFVDAQPAVERLASPCATLVIDVEEDFDWDYPIAGTSHSTAHLRHIGVLQSILAAYGAVPTYMVTYPVLEDEAAVRALRYGAERGECALGIQLHPWVTPPFDDAHEHEASYSGNLDVGLEESKLLALLERFKDCFGFAPAAYRAGRYGLGRQTGRILEDNGFRVDTSIAPRTDFSPEGGPDYTRQDCRPFWFGGSRRLLEVPLCRSIIGWGGAAAPFLYRAMTGKLLAHSRAVGILTRSRCAERITLSPEGNDPAAMRRLVRSLLAHGQHVLPLSFHSSSIHPGRNPYVRDKAGLHDFYDRLSGLLSHLADDLGARFVRLDSLPDYYLPPEAPR